MALRHSIGTTASAASSRGSSSTRYWWTDRQSIYSEQTPRQSRRSSRRDFRYMLVDKTVRQLLDAFAAPTPTPGGGSAAALAGAVSASLLVMVAAMPKTKSGTPEERAVLDGALPTLKNLSVTLIDLVDRDAAS